MDVAAIRARSRLVGVAVAAGAVVVVPVLVGVALWTGDVRLATRKVFAVGAILFGMGLLGWSSSVMVGGAVEAMQDTLDTRTNWTESDSRRAMARIGGFGAGWMAGSSFAATLAA